MTLKPSKPASGLLRLLFSLLITLGLLGIIWDWLYPRILRYSAQSDEHLFSIPSPLPKFDPQMVDRFSHGERLLIKPVTTLAKREGIAAFTGDDYQTAVKWFEESLKVIPNDPETLIYLNNARLRATGISTHTIAVSIPIGKNLDVAQEILRGAAQAQFEALQTDGTLAGFEIQIINDDNNPNLIQRIARTLVNDVFVLAVIGHNTSDASLAGASIYQEHGLVMVSPTTFDPNVSKVGNYIFRAVPTAQSMSAALVEHLTNQSSQPAKTLICYDADAPDNAVFRDAFVDTLIAQGGEIVRTINSQGNDLCNFASYDFNAKKAVAQAIAQGANSIYLGPSINYLDPAIEVARVNDGRLSLFGSPSLYTQKIVKDGQRAVEGLVLVAPWNPSAYPDFARRARTLWKATVNWRTATAYDATRAVIAAAQQGKTRQGMQQVLQSPDFSISGSGALVRFLDTRDRRLVPVFIQVVADDAGNFRFEAMLPEGGMMASPTPP